MPGFDDCLRPPRPTLGSRQLLRELPSSALQLAGEGAIYSAEWRQPVAAALPHTRALAPAARCRRARRRWTSPPQCERCTWRLVHGGRDGWGWTPPRRQLPRPQPWAGASPAPPPLTALHKLGLLLLLCLRVDGRHQARDLTLLHHCVCVRVCGGGGAAVVGVHTWWWWWWRRECMWVGGWGALSPPMSGCQAPLPPPSPPTSKGVPAHPSGCAAPPCTPPSGWACDPAAAHRGGVSAIQPTLGRGPEGSAGGVQPCQGSPTLPGGGSSPARDVRARHRPTRQGRQPAPGNPGKSQWCQPGSGAPPGSRSAPRTASPRARG